MTDRRPAQAIPPLSANLAPMCGITGHRTPYRSRPTTRHHLLPSFPVRNKPRSLSFPRSHSRAPGSQAAQRRQGREAAKRTLDGCWAAPGALSAPESGSRGMTGPFPLVDLSKTLLDPFQAATEPSTESTPPPATVSKRVRAILTPFTLSDERTFRGRQGQALRRASATLTGIGRATKATKNGQDRQGNDGQKGGCTAPRAP